nr:hypothetical protein [Flavobacterium ginsengisoli]
MNTEKPNNITSLLYNTFSPRNLRANINNLSYLPRWIIVGIDVMVLVFSFCLTYLLFEGTAIGYLITSHNFFFVAGLIIANVFFSGFLEHTQELLGILPI